MNGLQAGIAVCLAALLASHAGLAQRAALPPLQAAGPVLDVKSFGARCDGKGDDTAAIRAAAAAVPAAGGTIVFASGTCLVSNTVALKSNTSVLGRGATIKNLPPAAWPHGVEGVFEMKGVANVTIEGMRFAWQHGTYNGGAAHILQAEQASHIVIRNNISDGGGDFMAVIGSSDVLMEGNRATEVDNSCYDAWGGATHIRVVNNFCSTTTRVHPGVGAIQFTGIATDQSPAFNQDFYAAGNIVYINTPNGQAFEINGSPKGGANDSIIITGNKIFIGAHAWGVLVTHASNGEISNNTIVATVPMVHGAVHVAATATNWKVIGNIASNITAGANGVFTNSGTGGAMADNTAYGSSSPLHGAAGRNIAISGNFALPARPSAP